MKNLHNIASFSAWMWNAVVNGRERPIETTDTGVMLYHLFRVQRGQPEAIGHYMRPYWRPYNIVGMSREEVLNPLCGRLRTRSTTPKLRPAWSEPTNENACAQCVGLAEARGIHGQLVRHAVRNDQWTVMMQIGQDMHRQADPVSGA